METKRISTNIANGTVHYSDRSESISDAEWMEHPQFKGIYLKLMIRGANTGGGFSAPTWLKSTRTAPLKTIAMKISWNCMKSLKVRGHANSLTRDLITIQGRWRSFQKEKTTWSEGVKRG